MLDLRTRGSTPAIEAPESPGASRGHWSLPAAVSLTALITALALVLTGVQVWELVRFLAYEVLVILGPGVIVYTAVAGPGARSWLERLVLGYAFGMAIELAAFSLTAWLDVRAWLPAYAVLVYVIAGAVGLARRGRGGSRSRVHTGPPAPATRLIACGVLCVATVSLAIGNFAVNPLPRDVGSVAYPPDMVFQLGLAAEARHHWPVGDPNVVGEPLHYHTFADLDMAGIDQITGIPLDVLLLRLWPVAMLLAIAGGVALLTLRVTGSRAAALLAVVLALLAGELEVHLGLESPFGAGSTLFLTLSPSYMLGAVFFLAAVCVMVDMLREGSSGTTRPGSGWRHMVVLAVLLLGASGAKASVLPVILGGLAIFTAIDWATRREVRPGSLAVGSIAALVFLISYVVLYRGGSGTHLELRPLHSIAGQVTVIGLLAPLVGVLGLVATRNWRFGSAGALLLSMFAAATLAYLFIVEPGGAELWFLMYGVLAVLPLSAMGIVAAWRLLPSDHATRRRWLVAGIAITVAGACLLVMGEELGRAAIGPSADRSALYPGVATPALLILALVVARWRLPEQRAGLTGLAILMVVLVSLLDYPLDTASTIVGRLSRGAPAWAESVPGRNSGMDRDLYHGLLWVRAHTPTSSVMAVNNVAVAPDDARYFYYGAFAERRAYLEGWEYSQRGVSVLGDKQLPAALQQRERLSLAAAAGRPDAIEALRRAGVDYLVVDRKNGPQVDLAAVGRVLRQRFSNDAVAIYDLGPAAALPG